MKSIQVLGGGPHQKSGRIQPKYLVHVKGGEAADDDHSYFWEPCSRENVDICCKYRYLFPITNFLLPLSGMDFQSLIEI